MSEKFKVVKGSPGMFLVVRGTEWVATFSRLHYASVFAKKLNDAAKRVPRKEG